MTTATQPRLDRTAFTTSRLLDFCSKKELVAQTGHDIPDWPLVVFKELLDNALDACEESRIAPEIEIVVDEAGITVSDNGPGIPETTIEAVLDFTVRVSTREAYVSPTRGAQGNALKTIVAIPYVLDGESGRIDIASNGLRHEIRFRADHIRQEPVIDREANADPNVKNGTSILVHWPDSAGSILHDAKARFLQIASDYTWLNPHLTLIVDWFGERIETRATAAQWLKWLPSDPTCPHWYDEDRFGRLVRAYIAHDHDAHKERTVRELVSEFRGLSGSAKQKEVLEASFLARTNLSALARNGDLDHEVVARLLAAMKEHTKPLKPPRLGVIGQDHLRARFEATGCEMESFQYKKVVGAMDDLPWVVETAFGWLPQSDVARRLVTGVNWSPGIVNPFRQLRKYGQSCDTILANQRVNLDEPVIIVLHMACPRVQYTDRGKSAVALGDLS